jgi:hypothetical protein
MSRQSPGKSERILKAESQLRDILLAGINSGPSVLADAAFFEGIRARPKAGVETESLREKIVASMNSPRKIMWSREVGHALLAEVRARLK